MKKVNGILSEVTEKDLILLKKDPKEFWAGVSSIGSGAFSDLILDELEVPYSVQTIDKNAYGDTFKSVIITENGLTFSHGFKETKKGMTIPYEFYLELEKNNQLSAFIENCSLKTFNNEMKPWKNEIQNLTPEELKNLYTFAYVLGCFSDEKLRDKNGKETKATVSQKRSSLLASFIYSGDLSIKEICSMFDKLTVEDKLSDSVVDFISQVNGKEHFNVTLIKELSKKFPDSEEEILKNFEMFQKRRKTIDAKSGEAKVVSWKDVFENYYTIKTAYTSVSEENLDIAEVFLKQGLPEFLYEYVAERRAEANKNNVPSHILGKEIKEKTISEQVGELRMQTNEILKDTNLELEDVYSKKFTYEWLSKKDPNNAIIGLFTQCCATIFDSEYGSSIVEATISAIDVQNLVIRDANGEIVAKGTIYVNFKHGYAVINEFEISGKYKQGERIAGRYDSSPESQAYKNRELIFNALMRGVKAFVEEYDKQYPETPIKQVNVGMRYNRLKEQCERYEMATDLLNVPFKYEFGDANKEQRVLYKREQEKTDELDK